LRSLLGALPAQGVGDRDDAHECDARDDECCQPTHGLIST
jgi:hypothetical protein